jgi:hypothetical protein
MDDDFDNEIGLPDDEIGGSTDDLVDVGIGGIEGELGPGAGEPGGTRSSGGARARQSTPSRVPKAAAPVKAAAKKKPAKKAAKKKPKAKAKVKKKPARKAARKSGKKAAKRKK